MMGRRGTKGGDEDGSEKDGEEDEGVEVDEGREM
jgi:hypothetical protein